jgi:hypothetical protein
LCSRSVCSPVIYSFYLLQLYLYHYAKIVDQGKADPGDGQEEEQAD